jgi:phosphoribosylaminoimidazolecarboxamide formyltransferase/IMP cyclohydrolase
MRALISVSDKTGVVELAQRLVELGFAIISTGQTKRTLAEAGIAAQAVSDVTGFPEILNGRVKTLHPAIHAGLLARRDRPAHLLELNDLGILPIDLVVVNLYPFSATVARPDVTDDEAQEQIDIGGVTLIRAAAKNYPGVLTLVDPADYAPVLAALAAGEVPLTLRKQLAARAFAHTAAYDTAITNYLVDSTLPDQLTLALPREQALRYGENPHQQAALYGSFLSHVTQLHGKELSYNNILDAAAALELIGEFADDDAAVVAILKHTNPCGVGRAAQLVDAWQQAFATDREAPFGGIIICNRTLDAATAAAIDEIFAEIVIAPGFAPEALTILQKKKNRRLLQQIRPVTPALQLRSVPGGLLVQQADAGRPEEWQVVTQRTPTEAELAALKFAWRVVKHVKSNAIVYADAGRTLGVGAGQMSRVDSARLAADKAARSGLSLNGAVLASDAFFPFADGLQVALSGGITAVIQPGGSVRDAEVIAAADAAGAAMVFTAVRHFRH